MFVDQVSLFFISLLANMFSSFSGGGAGLIQLPALIFLGLPFSLALATHKVASVALGLGATARHLRDNRLEKTFVVMMLAAGIPGVVLGTQIIVHVPDHMAHIALGLLTIGLGLYSISSPELGKHDKPTHRTLQGYVTGALVLFLIAVLNGSLTSGTGLFATLWLVRWFGMDYLKAVAHTLVLVGVAWNGTGAISLGVVSTIEWVWVPTLIAGSLLGGYAGAHLAVSKGNATIKKAYEAVTLLVGIKLLMGSASW